MGDKCEMFVNCSKTFLGICEKKIWLNKEYIQDHRCERTNIALKCKIYEPVNLTLHGHYKCVYSFWGYWHKDRKQNISGKWEIHN